MWLYIQRLCWPQAQLYMVVDSTGANKSYYLFIRKVHEYWKGNQRQISRPISRYSTLPTHILERSWVFVLLFWSKEQLYLVADYTDANKRSILVHHKGTQILGWRSKTAFLTNITLFYPANPYFGAKFSVWVASPTKNTTIYGCRLYGYQWKFNISSSKRSWSMGVEPKTNL